MINNCQQRLPVFSRALGTRDHGCADTECGELENTRQYFQELTVKATV